MRQQSLSTPPEITASATFEDLEFQHSEGEEPRHEQTAADHCDPLCDEHADSDDERWVARNLLHVTSDKDSQGQRTKEPRVDTATDPVSCPSCFSILSLQTQAHVRFEGQFRAIFVTNCKIVTSQRLRVSGQREDNDEIYQPVACIHCLTEVGVRDNKGVYHFCNVMY